jgi:hypothetical protein
MISIVTYGRNDNYGFNLVKRTALGFNCLAELLTEEDEILFVDYNTPDHLPTLPEFIWDSFTEKAMRLIKVIRISRDIHEQIKKDSPLQILENVSRNAAIVRSNPENKWILSTNPDVILVLSSKWPTLTEMLRTLQPSFYEMPRFDIPESVWSSLRRDQPVANLDILRDWIASNGAAVAETISDWRFQKYLLFEAPGDFQLAPRDYYFRLRGFDESMNKYLHSDSNLAKRMWLLNGRKTDHLLERLWVLHQDHYLTGEWASNVGAMVHNDVFRKVLREDQITANDGNWGLQQCRLPVFSLADKVARQRALRVPIQASLNGNLSLTREPNWLTQAVYQLVNYDPRLLALYLRENLQLVAPDANVVYVGKNVETLGALRHIWKEVSPEGTPIRHLSEAVAGGEHLSADVLLVDFYYERSDEWQRRVAALKERLQEQVEKGRLTELEAQEEVSRFANSADLETMAASLVPIWEKELPYAKVHRGTYVILMGCNLYVPLYARFKEAFAASLGLETRPTLLQRLHRSYQRFNVNMAIDGHYRPGMKALAGIRFWKRRMFRGIIGHESVMGLLYFHQVVRQRNRLNALLKLKTLYVHHRLVVLRSE